MCIYTHINKHEKIRKYYLLIYYFQMSAAELKALYTSSLRPHTLVAQ